MDSTKKRIFSINQSSPETAFTHPNVTSITKTALAQSTTHQPEQTTKIIPLGITENESIEDANIDMDLLVQQSLEDS